MHVPRMVVAAATCLALIGPGGREALSAEKVETFVPPNYPLNIAPVDWPTNPGTRYTMSELARRYPAADIVIKLVVTGWTEQMWKAGDMGTCKVGDRVHFSVVIGDRGSRYFGSVKDRTDGGDFQCTVHWMDESGRKALKQDKTCVRHACATCGGFFSMYFDVPSSARTGRHRLNVSYVHKKLKLDLSKDLHFKVVNDGSWDDRSVLDAAAARHPAVLMLQPGRPCKALGVEAYGGLDDTYMLAPNPVPDRRMDRCNFGRLAFFNVGQYGQDNRALLRFDLSEVPPDAAVAGAWLQLYLSAWPGSRGTNRLTVVAYDVLKPWKPGRGCGSLYGGRRDPPVLPAEASWQCHAHPDKWAEPGCGRAGEDRGKTPVGASKQVSKTKTWVTIPLDARLVARWIKRPRSNNGLLLVGKGSRGQFHSSQFEDPPMRPRLIVAFSTALARPRS